MMKLGIQFHRINRLLAAGKLNVDYVVFWAAELESLKRTNTAADFHPDLASSFPSNYKVPFQTWGVGWGRGQIA